MNVEQGVLLLPGCLITHDAKTYSTLLMQIYKSIIHHNLLLSDVSCWFSLWKIVKTIWKHQQLTQQLQLTRSLSIPNQAPTWAHAQCNGENLGDATLGPTLGINALLWLAEKCTRNLGDLASVHWVLKIMGFTFRVQEIIVFFSLYRHKQGVSSGLVSQLYNMHNITR